MQKSTIFVVVALAIGATGWLFYQNGALPMPDLGPQPVAAECYVGGCSGQICSDEQGVASTCEFRAEDACYQTAKCERQATGECGWTDTTALRLCLSNPPPLE